MFRTVLFYPVGDLHSRRFYSDLLDVDEIGVNGVEDLSFF